MERGRRGLHRSGCSSASFLSAVATAHATATPAVFPTAPSPWHGWGPPGSPDGCGSGDSMAALSEEEEDQLESVEVGVTEDDGAEEWLAASNDGQRTAVPERPGPRPKWQSMPGGGIAGPPQGGPLQQCHASMAGPELSLRVGPPRPGFRPSPPSRPPVPAVAAAAARPPKMTSKSCPLGLPAKTHPLPAYTPAFQGAGPGPPRAGRLGQAPATHPQGHALR